ncbi:hypothetical protein CCP3SC15_1440004 [Gammaproteobacteria bacterium]
MTPLCPPVLRLIVTREVGEDEELEPDVLGDEPEEAPAPALPPEEELDFGMLMVTLEVGTLSAMSSPFSLRGIYWVRRAARSKSPVLRSAVPDHFDAHVLAHRVERDALPVKPHGEDVHALLENQAVEFSDTGELRFIDAQTYLLERLRSSFALALEVVFHAVVVHQYPPSV